MAKLTLLVAGILGFLAVLLDALGTHALPLYAASPETLEKSIHAWQIAARYQLTHALLLIAFGVLLLRKEHVILKAGAVFTTLGSLLFCGSIYTKVLTGNPLLGQLAPLGGICFMLAWLCIGLTAFGAIQNDAK
jgi:uncharacterized membrane protein YgdD (TMEM256/DUF423 family)